MGTVVTVVALVVLALCALGALVLNKLDPTTPEQRRKAKAKQRRQAQEEVERQRVALKCPHCDVAGGVSRRMTRRKVGVSGGKATGAVLTGGISLFATGLSRKQTMTEMACSNCGQRWTVAV